MFGCKKFWFQKIFGSKKYLGPTNFGSKNFWVQQNVWSEKIGGLKKFEPEKYFESKRGRGHKGLRSLSSCHFFQKWSDFLIF